jgi:hypothetical protein
LEPPDHDLENRSAVGASTGTMHSVRFGTGSEREKQHAHLADYYRLVDRGLNRLFREADSPLILAGVEEETAIYQAVSAYSGLVKRTIAGSQNISREQSDPLKQAYSILHASGAQRQRAAMTAAMERAAPARFSTDPETILRAAFEGRVGELYISENAERIDMFERGAYQSCGSEDLLNLAAVQTIIHHGKYCELPSEMMPNRSAVAGIMRF